MSPALDAALDAVETSLRRFAAARSLAPSDSPLLLADRAEAAGALERLAVRWPLFAERASRQAAHIRAAHAFPDAIIAGAWAAEWAVLGDRYDAAPGSVTTRADVAPACYDREALAGVAHALGVR